MKRRYRYFLNVFAVSLLLFSLYLNFIKKETGETDTVPAEHENLLPANRTIKTGKETSSIHEHKLNVVLK